MQHPIQRKLRMETLHNPGASSWSVLFTSVHISSAIKYASSKVEPGRAYLHSMEQHAITDAYTIANHTLQANGHIWPNLTIITNLGGRVHNVVAYERRPLC